MRPGKRSLLAVLFTAAALGLHFIANKGRAMDQDSNNRLVTLFKTTRIVCVGRFVLEIPMESEVIYGPARLPYMIERWPGYGEKLDKMINSRLSEIEEDRARARGPLLKSDSMFGKVISGSVADQQIIFGAAKSIGSFYEIESIQRVGEDLFIQWTTSYGDAYRDAVVQLKNIAPLLRARPLDAVPAEPGICLDGAFIVEPSSPIYEAVTLGVRLRQFPDVHFSIELITKDKKVEGDSLEARSAAAEEDARQSGAGAWYDRVRVIRRGERKIGNWTGSEYLARKPRINQVMESHEFAFFSHGEPGNHMVPSVEIELDTGVKGNKASGMRSSISDEEALYLWDRITSSIRPWAIGKPRK
jgi:hypothetical protein